MAAEHQIEQHIRITKMPKGRDYTKEQDCEEVENSKPYRSVLDRLSSNPGAEILRYGWRKPDVLSLGQGQGDAPTPDFIIDATTKAMGEGKTFYGPALGQPALRQEISNYYSKIYKYNIPTNRIFITGSGTTAMHLALTSVLDEGDEVVAVTPIWKNLLGAVELAQASLKQVPLNNDDEGWSLDLEKLFDACSSKTKAILLVTPSNPTGWCASRKEIQAILEFARERNIWIISDEVYSRLVYEGDHAPSFLEFAEPEDLVYTINSFSKAWAMTGWRLGWIVGPPCAEAKIRDIALYDNLGAPTFTQFGAIEALRYGEGFIKEQIELWRSNRDLVQKRLGPHNAVHVQKPEATFYSFFRVEGEENSMKFAQRLIDDVSLSMAPGCAFGDAGKPYMRLCFAVSENLLNDALDRLEKAL